MNSIYLYVTPSGSVNLIEGDKMPVGERKTCGGKGFCCDYNTPCQSLEYGKHIESAKASSVLCGDQERAKKIIIQWLNDQPIGQGMIEPERFYGPFDVGYEIRDKVIKLPDALYNSPENQNRDSAIVGSSQKVAILLPENNDPPIKHKGEEYKFKIVRLEKELQETRDAWKKDRDNLQVKRLEAELTPSKSGELKSNSDRIIDLTERIRIETYQKILRRGEPELAKVNNEVITLLQCQGQQKVYCQELEDKIDALEKQLEELKSEPVGKIEEKKEWSALEIAIYACNAGNSEESINEVAGMIERFKTPFSG